MFTFEAEFGDIKIEKIRVKKFFTLSTEENEFFVTIWDAEKLLDRTEILKGKCNITHMVKVPASCPHCHKELPMSETLKDFESFLYHGATIKGMTKVDNDVYTGDIIELRIHYEILEYKNHVTQTIAVLNVT